MFADPKAENEVSEDEKGAKAKERVVRKVESIFKKPHRAAGKLTLSDWIDWKQRVLRIERKGKVFEIKALAIADSYRMTCPVVRGDTEMKAAVTHPK